MVVLKVRMDSRVLNRMSRVDDDWAISSSVFVEAMERIGGEAKKG